MDKISEKISKDLDIERNQVDATIRLLDEGNTIPFIARYRKEVTGNLEDYQVRDIAERLEIERNLDQRREEIKRLIGESMGLEDLDQLDQSLIDSIDRAGSLSDLEDIYRPYRPKRETRASKAKDKGLEGLAGLILGQNISKEELYEKIEKSYINDQVGSIDEAIAGTKDIIAQIIADSPVIRKKVKNIYYSRASLVTRLKNEDRDLESVYENYYDYCESIRTIPDHRVLAINRGEREEVLRVTIDLDVDLADNLASTLVKDPDSYIGGLYFEAIEDGLTRLVKPSIEREIRSSLTEEAEAHAIEVFAKNLKPLLLQAPLKDKRILAIDPAFRTGCKLVALDELGQLLTHDTIYPHEPHNRIDESKEVLKGLIEEYDLEIIAIGNGTASRETEVLVADLLDEMDREDLSYTIVSEAGASVYSASIIGREEFPDLDVSIRGAVSIGRRIQDPLAELVKIDPKHIGVGQYQHDLNQKNLDRVLDGVVEDSVNSVGVNLNTASKSLLSYVSGLSSRAADNILDFRNENGRFTNIDQLKDVKGIGPKTFTQAAGFLRIPDGDNELDNTGVHPESYPIAERLLDMDYQSQDLDDLSKSLDIGRLTLEDIIEELEKPGRDPRDQMDQPILRNDIMSIEDLEEGMLVKGVVRNIVDFGAFVDIGVGEDGLIHISELSDRHIKDVADVLNLGDIVDVKIINLDIDRKRIGLSMKGL